jgi:hypothetical protein
MIFLSPDQPSFDPRGAVGVPYPLSGGYPCRSISPTSSYIAGIALFTTDSTTTTIVRAPLSTLSAHVKSAKGYYLVLDGRLLVSRTVHGANPILPRTPVCIGDYHARQYTLP